MKALVMEFRYVDISPAGKRRIAKCEREGLCVACLEPVGEGMTVRGMHANTCSKATWRLIRAGKTTEAARVKEGKMLERDQPGRKPSNPVTLDVMSN